MAQKMLRFRRLGLGPHLRPAVTPGISAQEYHDRRAALAAQLAPDSVAVLAAADLKYRSGAVFYPYRQDSNFLYLTGFAEQDSLAVIRKTGPQPEDFLFALFVRPKDPRAEQWSGPWSGTQAAQDVFNADEALDINAVDAELPRLLKGAKKVYTDIELSRGGRDTKFAALLGRLRAQPLAPLVHAQRAIKSEAEVANMRRAGRLSGRALTDAMRRPWASERQLAAFLDNEYALSGLDGQAYVPVVAGGPRGRMIHYVQNNAALRADEMVLVDAGGEYGTYVADITRTWPASGRFAPAQRDLYSAVLRAQRTGVSLCRAAAGLSLDRIHAVVEDALRAGLVELGFDTSGDAMSVLFPHHVGHYVGLDVHDTPGYPRHVALRPGHCVTVEPGVYVPDDARWPAHFRGMGVRIEDSVCVGEEDPYILTTEAVKEVDDIEALREQ
ncbi:uncharacterized protein E0L32_011463 [Thyridium curvatum]|uniref:Xaa-Pro aminopeptidase n=1 Tax=Thyridium curvatum TaxID=1093900 RepID=A0A507BPU6_9PEZI|nr:uncharacterized protein E0L32_011463 [Thyridium curvatum]TPX18848.1 hypothetical protein E0L32_011463 [Thyridium curvatum]